MLIFVVLILVYTNVGYVSGFGQLLMTRMRFMQQEMTMSALPDKRLSSLVEGMSISKTIEIHAMTKEMEARGEEVFSLCVGEPDYQPPTCVIDATVKAAKSGMTKYTGVSGTPALRKEICKDLMKRKGLSYSPDQILLSSGAKQSIAQAFMAVVNPGDKVLIPAPYWPSYIDMIKICQAEPVIFETFEQDSFAINAKSLRKTLEQNPEIKAMIICNPSNPTGCNMELSQLEAVSDVLREFQKVFVISDEIYEHLTYDCEHFSFANLKGMSERTLTINGFSKGHSMTGYRIGYMAGPLDVIRAATKIQSQLTSCASSISQEAALAALTETPADWLPARVAELKEKRDLAHEIICRIPDVTCKKGDGAFYLLPNVSAFYGKKTQNGDPIEDAHALCLNLLKAHGVALVSGDAFGAPDCIRVSYAASEQLIRASLGRLSSFLLSLE
jgi:aspartate/methionine/tyrosine aminotransferase